MTLQYDQPSINNPGAVRNFSTDGDVTTDDSVVVIENGNPTLRLPFATTIPGMELSFKSLTGTGTVVARPGETIDGAPSFSFSAVDEALELRSDGDNWLIIDGGAGGGGNTIEVQDEGVPVAGGPFTTLNFTGAGVAAALGLPGVANVNIPGGGIADGPDIPEGSVIGAPGDLYRRVNGEVSTLWQYLGVAPGVVGWRALGPFLTGIPVGAIDGANQTYSVPGGIEAVDQAAILSSQVELQYNGVQQKRGVDFATVAGSIAGVTISGVTFLNFAPLPGDELLLIFVPA